MYGRVNNRDIEMKIVTSFPCTSFSFYTSLHIYLLTTFFCLHIVVRIESKTEKQHLCCVVSLYIHIYLAGITKHLLSRYRQQVIEY